jgi:hypothetical protein
MLKALITHGTKWAAVLMRRRFTGVTLAAVTQACREADRAPIVVHRA